MTSRRPAPFAAFTRTDHLIWGELFALKQWPRSQFDEASRTLDEDQAQGYFVWQNGAVVKPALHTRKPGNPARFYHV